MVVGEISGDNLGAALIRALKSFYPDIMLEGILGPKLIQEGGHSLYPMERFSVMGLIEPLSRLPELYCARKKVIQHFIQHPPDIFIGIDSPDTNLGIEKQLKAHGIPTVHYVSPSVWAWRQGRIKLIKKAVDLMLTLLPFEAEFYQQHQVPVCFTGHPLADEISLEIDSLAAKQHLNFSPDKPLIALLPGSRNNELKYLADIYIVTAKYCYEKNPSLQFVAPLVSEAHKFQFQKLHHVLAPEVPIKVIVGEAKLAMAAADVVLVTSGTATLEVMLHKKPMVVAYRMHPLTYQIAKRLVKVPYIALPNLLANSALVPEYIQGKAKPQVLGEALLNYLSSSDAKQKLVQRFTELHQILKQNGSIIAAQAIQKLLKKVPGTY